MGDAHIVGCLHLVKGFHTVGGFYKVGIVHLVGSVHLVKCQLRGMSTKRDSCPLCKRCLLKSMASS